MGAHAGTVRFVRLATSGGVSDEYGSATGVPMLQVGVGANRPEPVEQARLARMVPLDVRLADGPPMMGISFS